MNLTEARDTITQKIEEENIEFSWAESDEQADLAFRRQGNILVALTNILVVLTEGRGQI